MFNLGWRRMHGHQTLQPYLTFKCQIRHRPFRQAGTFPHKFHLQLVTIYAYTALQCSWQQCQVHSESDAILILTWNSILIEYSFLQCDFYWVQKGMKKENNLQQGKIKRWNKDQRILTEIPMHDGNIEVQSRLNLVIQVQIGMLPWKIEQ